MEFGLLLASGITALVLAVFLLFLPKVLQNLDEAGNKTMFAVDNKVVQSRKTSGLLLVIIGIALLMVKQFLGPTAFPEEATWMNMAAMLGIALGLLILFLPETLLKVSETGNKFLFPTDQEAFLRRNILGVVFLLAGVYIFYVMFTTRWVTV